MLDEVLTSRMLRQGFDFLEPEQGLELLGEALGRPDAQLGVLPLSLGRLAQSMAEREVPSMLRDLVETPERTVETASASQELASRLHPLPAKERRRVARKLIGEEIARILAMPAEMEIPAEKPLFELGLDSLMAVEVRNSLSRLAGKRLPVTLVFDYPTIDVVAGYLIEEVLEQDPESAVAQPTEPVVEETGDPPGLDDEDGAAFLEKAAALLERWEALQ